VCSSDLQLLSFFGLWTNSISDTIRWPEYRRKILKYTPFVNFDEVKSKTILKKVINEKVH
jgi:hypothetical protein